MPVAITANLAGEPGLSPQITMGTIGHEACPVVIVDNFVSNPDAVRDAAVRLEWARLGDYYPGPRAPVEQSYLIAITPVLRAVLTKAFGLSAGAEVLRCYYSLATSLPAELELAQRIPHVDAYYPEQVAMVHYLCPAVLGGTNFYRHRATGFERIDEPRSRIYHAALSADFAAGGEPPPSYIGESSPYFECIGGCDAVYNRAVFFPGNLLHCAALDGVALPASPLVGRLTIAAFIRPSARP